MLKAKKRNLAYAENKKEKVKSPFKVWHVAVLALIAAAVICFIHFSMLKYYNVYPFSSRVPAQYDLLAQIIPFAEHFFDVLSGEGSLFYSYRVGGGMDIFGTVAYCLVSPFSFIYWIFGEGNVWHSIAYMVPAKLVCISLSALIMIKLCFPQTKKPVALLIALCYTYCGYVFVSNTYINWMDFLIWFPLLIPAFRRLVNTGKIFWFSFFLALTIYTCFSIACFSMFISYPLCVIYAFMVVQKGERKRYLTKLTLGFLCAVIAAAPILVPSLMAYMSSGRNTGLFGNLWNGYSEESYTRKLSYILSDGIFIVFILCYFIKTHFRDKQSRFLGVAGLFIMMPVLIDECCNLMNMGSYMSYALRFGFLNAVYELYVTALFLEKASLKFRRKTRVKTENGQDGAPLNAMAADKKERKMGLNAYLLCDRTENKVTVLTRRDIIERYILPAVVTVLLIFLTAYSCVTIEDIYDEAYASGSFMSSFAHSTGGLKYILKICVVVAVFTLLVVLLYVCRLAPPKIICACMAVLVIAQSAFYGGTLVSGNIFNHIRYDQYNTLYSEVMEDEELESYEFRVKDFGNYISDNQGFFTNSASYSVFSSMTADTNFAYNTVFGMGGNGVNTLKSSGGTLLGNCLLSNKYYFYNSEGSEETRPTLNYDYLKEVGRDTYFIMYKNNLSFPSAFTVSSGDMGVVTDYDSYLTNMENLYSFLGGGNASIYTEYSLYTKNTVYGTNKINVVEETAKDSDGNVIYDENGDTIPVVHIKMYIPESGDYTFKPGFSEEEAEARGIKWYTTNYYSQYDLTEIKTFTYVNGASNSYYNIYLAADDALTGEEVAENCSYVCISKDTVEELYNSVSARGVRYTMSSSLLKTTISTTVTADSQGQYLFINYVKLDGHTAYVNGNKVDLIDNGLNMLLVPLEEGENEVVIEYFSPSVTYACVAFGIGALLLILIALVFCDEKGRRRIERIKTPVAVLSVAVAVAVTAFFVVFPTGVFFYKLIFLW